MSKCSVFSTSKLKLPYCTLLRPKYCASAAETNSVTARKATTAARITRGLLEKPAPASTLFCEPESCHAGGRTGASYPLQIPTVQRSIPLETGYVIPIDTSPGPSPLCAGTLQGTVISPSSRYSSRYIRINSKKYDRAR